MISSFGTIQFILTSKSSVYLKRVYLPSMMSCLVSASSKFCKFLVHTLFMHSHLQNSTCKVTQFWNMINCSRYYITTFSFFPIPASCMMACTMHSNGWLKRRIHLLINWVYQYCWRKRTSWRHCNYKTTTRKKSLVSIINTSKESFGLSTFAIAAFFDSESEATKRRAFR